MANETLIEQAKQFAFFTGRVVYDDTWVKLMADFAAKIRDEAVAAERAGFNEAFVKVAYYASKSVTDRTVMDRILDIANSMIEQPQNKC